MSEVCTVIDTPGVFGGGLLERKRITRAEMIKQLRDYAAYEKEKFEKILATPDDAFQVRVVRGLYVQHLIEELNP